MDNGPSDTTYIALIHHQLLNCSAEVKVNATESKGGNVTFESTLEAPDDNVTMKTGESYSIKILLDCTGKIGNTENVAFHATCQMEGICMVVNAPNAGVKSTATYWLPPANQLYPLLSQYVNEMISRMGFKNVIVPPFMQDLPVAVDKKGSKIKKIKKMPTLKNN